MYLWPAHVLTHHTSEDFFQVGLIHGDGGGGGGGGGGWRWVVDGDSEIGG